MSRPRASFDRDDAVLSDAIDGLRDELADRPVVMGGDGRHLGDLLGAGDGLRAPLEVLGHHPHGAVDAALQGHRVGTGGDVPEPFMDDGLCEDGGGGGAVPATSCVLTSTSLMSWAPRFS